MCPCQQIVFPQCQIITVDSDSWVNKWSSTEVRSSVTFGLGAIIWEQLKHHKSTESLSLLWPKKVCN